MIYHVSMQGDDLFAGTASSPFRTINHAAQLVKPGDTVQVHTGIYREWVDPVCGGRDQHCRVTFEAAPGEHPVIKGSEIIKGWERFNDRVHKVTLPNRFFGDFNPYSRKIEGDWLRHPIENAVHLGDVYLNGVSMYEAASLEAVYEAPARMIRSAAHFDHALEDTQKQWFAVVDEEHTSIYCNFQGADPNTETVEINVRPCCFYPRETGRNYITVRGFEMAHAATAWAPPTGNQPGMLGPHWSRGWVIEDNHLHDAKCCALSLGKDASTGDHMYSHYKRKPAYFYQIEALFNGLRSGWSADQIGSHLVSNNLIHDCGQAGIVGHMGCIFSKIEHNEIYRIGTKNEFWGDEIAGIKFHAPIDVLIENNNIYDSPMGIWLDWQAQGTRITRNILHDNKQDLLIEITHGPCLIDNNLFLSEFSYDEFAQGLALVHNLFAGNMNIRVENLGRSNPYHLHHSTQVAGYAEVLGGDIRLINNMMLGQHEDQTDTSVNFSKAYDRFTTQDEFVQKNIESPSASGIMEWKTIPQPVWIEGNAYAGNSTPFRAEQDAIRTDGLSVLLEDLGDCLELNVDVPPTLSNVTAKAVTTNRLGYARFPEQAFEQPDGKPVDFTADQRGEIRNGNIIPGPFAILNIGKQKLTVWKRNSKWEERIVL